jgi:hypothetical protein
MEKVLVFLAHIVGIARNCEHTLKKRLSESHVVLVAIREREYDPVRYYILDGAARLLGRHILTARYVFKLSHGHRAAILGYLNGYRRQAARLGRKYKLAEFIAVTVNVVNDATVQL